MANRIIRESICSSDTIDGLTPAAEVTFYRLLVCVDDYGRIDGRPAMLRSKLYPLRTHMAEDEVAMYMGELEAAGLIWSYQVDGRLYYQVTTWEEYQKVRNKRSKCPAPHDNNCPQVADNCQQVADNCSQVAAECCLNPNPNPNPNPKPEGERVRAENAAPSPAASGHLGADLSPDEIEREQTVQEQAEQYVRAYGLPYNARTLDAIASDIREKGADAVKAALDAATDADTKGGISLKFYRSILNGTGGHVRKGRDAPGDMIHHTREEWDRSSCAAIIDLDDE